MIEFMLWARVSQEACTQWILQLFYIPFRSVGIVPAFTVEIPCKTCYPWSCTKKKRAAHKGMEHTLECDASCIGKLESKTTSAKIFQSKTPMMSHSLHSWSRQDGLLPQEFVSPLLHKIPGTLTTIGQLHVRKFLARARSFFAITSYSYILRMIEIQSGELCRNASYFFITWLRCPIPKQLLIPIIL